MKLSIYARTAAVTAFSAILFAGVTATSAEAQRGWRGGPGFHAGGPGHFGGWRGGGWRGGAWGGGWRGANWRGGAWGGGWRGAGWRGAGWRGAGWRGPGWRAANWGGGWGWNNGWGNDWGWGAAGLLGGLALGTLASNSWGAAPGWGGGYYGAGWDVPVYSNGPYYRQCICR
jgi:hypothetical protein